jgi:prolipoprotein diacylglyceryltransferase
VKLLLFLLGLMYFSGVFTSLMLLISNLEEDEKVPTKERIENVFIIAFWFVAVPAFVGSGFVAEVWRVYTSRES